MNSPQRHRGHRVKAVVLAQAGTHFSTARASDKWIPAFAEMTVLSSRALCLCGLPIEDVGARDEPGHGVPPELWRSAADCQADRGQRRHGDQRIYHAARL